MRSVQTSLLEIETVKVKLIFFVLQKSRSATASIIYFYYTVHLYGICCCSVNIITAVTIPYKFILKTKFSKRCNSCFGCPDNTKFCSQTDLSMKILILSSISAEYADKRWIKITRIKEFTETVTPCWFVFY